METFWLSATNDSCTLPSSLVIQKNAPKKRRISIVNGTGIKPLLGVGGHSSSMHCLHSLSSVGSSISMTRTNSSQQNIQQNIQNIKKQSMDSVASKSNGSINKHHDFVQHSRNTKSMELSVKLSKSAVRLRSALTA